ncbi:MULTISPECIES: fimbrial protein [Providencia]|jgi:type 1 fimbria pilin|uniref:fimbrial protein n=1 Tax=Providencia TaxID=586 RepID=UPI001C5A92A3|nr:MULTISPECIES: fimbrial protein [Providencia]ELR5150423.1 type 1 fimbrial protein [Providencia rettgeri]MDR2227091.1 type 1 fimbrial protein [Providencia sp.]QXX83040.1 type 1 fimbrial protein [Providencia sp. R33]
MNKITKGTLNTLFIAAFLFSAQAVSYDAVFNITGRVAANTCSVKSSRTLDVNLGDHLIGANNFGNKVGSQTKDVKWQIDLDCDKDTKIEALLRGSGYTADNTVLILPRVTGGADGVGIRTSYSNDKVLWHWMVLNRNITIHSSGVNGKTSLYFSSYYVQMEQTITPGKANANIDVEITYR